jgi:hypothetical protein
MPEIVESIPMIRFCAVCFYFYDPEQRWLDLVEINGLLAR